MFGKYNKRAQPDAEYTVIGCALLLCFNGQEKYMSAYPWNP